MFDRWSMIIVLNFVFYRYRYCVLNVRQMIYDQHSSYVCISDFLLCHYLTYHLWPSFYMFVTSRVQYSVLIVRHFICEHRCFCLCHLEINTVPLTIDISFIIIVVYIRVFQRWREFVSSVSSSAVQYRTILLYISYMIIFLYLCVFSRVKYHVLTARHMFYDHYCLWSCLPELHTIFLLFVISSMTFLFYVCVFQSSIVCPYCSTFHLWSPLLMFMFSRDNITFLMFNVSSMIIAIHSCVFQRSNMVSLMFDISPMIIILYACVYQRYIPCP